METLPISTPIEDEEDDHFSDALDQIPSASPSPLKPNPNPSIPAPTPNQEEPNNDDEDMEEPESNKKQKPISLFTPQPPSKRPKKKSNNVWTKPTSRKGKKKQPKSSTHTPASSAYPSSLTHHKTPFLTPTPTNPLRLSDDTPDLPVLLSRLYKADKVDLSDDRLTAGSSKGYRMVRATRGVAEGEWFFEIKITHLGPTGHCRLGWATENGDLQAPVGYDGFSYGYRDLEGSKVHRALRERYGEEGYGEGDVIGFYISLPDGGKFVPERRLHCLDWYKAGRGLGSTEKKEEEGPKVVPGSEISFFKNGVCQGVAYKDVSGGRYYPAASMYTMPNQPNCEVRFNFGPNFEFFPQDFGGRPIPRPMSEVPYHDFDVKVEAPTENGFHN